jgi:hypothetical protein
MSLSSPLRRGETMGNKRKFSCAKIPRAYRFGLLADPRELITIIFSIFLFFILFPPTPGSRLHTLNDTELIFLYFFLYSSLFCIFRLPSAPFYFLIPFQDLDTEEVKLILNLLLFSLRNCIFSLAMFCGCLLTLDCFDAWQSGVIVYELWMLCGDQRG